MSLCQAQVRAARPSPESITQGARSPALRGALPLGCKRWEAAESRELLAAGLKIRKSHRAAPQRAAC